jgi:hypothetical protein
MLDPEYTNHDSLRYIKVSTQIDTESIQESSWHLHHAKASLWSLFSSIKQESVVFACK